ncbi:hypothetical protein GCM10023093_17300 [Nemorincola caseinilytica]|uniref:Uncharacterized protein n=1 Tax=Nemorincola caseinilytica TaxID=2054315 RepID=A0ABP8ND20_9BACT
MGAKYTRPTLKITAGRNDIERLAEAYDAAVQQMPHLMDGNDTGHEALLYDHAVEMRDLLGGLIGRGQQTFTITMRISDARAAWQLWQWGFDVPMLCAMAVRRLRDVLDRERVSGVIA